MIYIKFTWTIVHIKSISFLFGCYWRCSLTEVDKKFELKLSKSQICLFCKIKNKKKRKKVKRAYSITTQKSKVFGIFDDKKVKNIDIECRLQLIFPNPAKTTGINMSVENNINNINISYLSCFHNQILPGY